MDLSFLLEVVGDNCVNKGFRTLRKENITLSRLSVRYFSLKVQESTFYLVSSAKKHANLGWIHGGY